MDIDLLKNALDNEENSKLFDLNSKKIKKIKMDVLKDFAFSRQVLLDYMNKLKDYRYIDSMNEFNYGRSIRWIQLTNVEDLSLKKGGVFCELSITDSGVYITCKTFYNTYFKIKMDECLLFQKLSDQELVLLKALDHLEK